MTDIEDIINNWGDAEWEKYYSKVQSLDDRYFNIFRQFRELQKDYEEINFGHVSRRLRRLEEQMEITGRELFTNAGRYKDLYSHEPFFDKPTLKNMLLLQMERLKHSSDVADQALLQFLEQTFQAKGYKSKPGITASRLAWSAYWLARSKGKSHSWAANHLAKRYNVSKKSIENQLSKLMRLIEKGKAKNNTSKDPLK